MPQPTRSQVHINAPLTNISVAFIQDKNLFVARKVFPGIPVQKQSDLFFTYPRDAWFRDEMKERAPGTESAGGGYDVSTDSYACRVWAYHKDVDDQIRANADDPIDLDREATEFLTQKYLLRLENIFVSKFFGTGLWTGSTTGTDITPSTLWSAAGGDPVGDVERQKKAMLQKTGLQPNKMVVTPDVDTALKENADIKDRVKYTQRAVITDDMLSALFGLEYLVMGAVQNTAKEGQTKSMNFIGGAGNAAIFHSAAAPGLYTPSAGYVFDWTGYAGAGKQGQTISTFRMDWLKSDRVEIEAAFDMKQIASDLGAFFTGCV